MATPSTAFEANANTGYFSTSGHSTVILAEDYLVGAEINVTSAGGSWELATSGQLYAPRSNRVLFSGTTLRGLAMSRDGKSVFISSTSSSSNPYSTDCGINWTTDFGLTMGATSAFYTVALSADGQVVLASDRTNLRYYSYSAAASGVLTVAGASDCSNDLQTSDDGNTIVCVNSTKFTIWNRAAATYTQPASVNTFTDGAISANGTKIVAIKTGSNIMRSTDSGANFGALTNSGVRNWTGITSSADGTKIVASVYAGNLYYSGDSGATWSALTSAGTKFWENVRCSSDCSTIVANTTASASGVYDSIYVSYDSGSTWAPLTSLGHQNWRYLTVSGDGSRICAAAYTGNTIHCNYLTTTVGVGTPAFSTNGLIKLIHAGLNKFIVTEHKDVQFY